MKVGLNVFLLCISATYEDPPPTPVQASQARWVGVRI
jgi:hypothetical protein